MLTEKEFHVDGKGNIKYKGNEKQKWRKTHYYLTVHRVNTSYIMTKGQKTRAKEIIDKFPLYKIHSRINNKAIILGICIYIMRKDGRGRQIHFTKGLPIEFGLKKQHYNVIERNLDRLLK